MSDSTSAVLADYWKAKAEALEEQLETLREAADTARGWLYHAKNGGGMKSAAKAFDVLDAEFHRSESSPAKEQQ